MGSPAASASPPWTLSLKDAFSSPETVIWEISYGAHESVHLCTKPLGKTGQQERRLPYVDLKVSVKQGLKIVV